VQCGVLDLMSAADNASMITHRWSCCS